ncbi:MAG: nucleoside triphosphate pyrophosphohydrolase [Alphaproteobacteria bacterium]|nr:nucleoside triphosphate pyrophosphohydrolase [Alphaproteobacteria bacterium]
MSTFDPLSFSSLLTIMARLRDPDGGCPWDLAQDFSSIAPYTIEEAYEVADAIERGDIENLREELGDLLLQPVYHAQMAAEKGLFDIHDVIRNVCEKMVRRHPHVFGDAGAHSPQDVDKIWDERKKAEKPAGDGGALEGVPLALPALSRALKLQKKAAKTGFEWTDPADILDKLEEELAEMREALQAGTLDQKADELGDLLFVLANLGRVLGVDPETALRRCNDKFERRFRGMESDATKKGQTLNALSLPDMEDLWSAQKKKENRA